MRSSVDFVWKKVDELFLLDDLRRQRLGRAWQFKSPEGFPAFMLPGGSIRSCERNTFAPPALLPLFSPRVPPHSRFLSFSRNSNLSILPTPRNGGQGSADCALLPASPLLFPFARHAVRIRMSSCQWGCRLAPTGVGNGTEKKRVKRTKPSHYRRHLLHSTSENYHISCGNIVDSRAR